MKKVIIAAILVSMLSACNFAEQKVSNKGNSTDQPQADQLSPSVTLDAVSNQTFTTPVYSNKATTRPVEVIQVGGPEVKLSDSVSCSSVNIKKGKLYCKFVPAWYADTIPSPSSYNSIPFEKMECESIDIQGSSMICEPK
jgi:hypothetical protein